MNRSGFSSEPIPFPTLSAALAHWRSTTPEALALTQGQEELTWHQLSDQVARCRSWLRGQGVTQGDCVVIVGHNSIPWIIHYLAVLELGAIIAPANNRLNPSQFSTQVRTLDAVMVLRDADHHEITNTVADIPIHDLAHDLPAAHDTTPVDLGHDIPALVSFTSGTTGTPKGATLSQGALAEASWAFVRVMHTTQHDSTLVVVPMFHNTGFIDQFGQMLLVGGRTDLLKKYRTALAIEALTTRPVTYLAAVPSIHRLIMLADGAAQALASLRILLYGGSPMPRSWIEEYLTQWPSIQLFHGYGLSEYGSAISFLPPEFARECGESIGMAVPFTSIRIVGEDGNEAAEGEVGELWAAGPTIMLGYWRQPELTASKIVGGFLRTGDLARRVGDLHYFEGRVDDVINRGGEKVLPSHVENVLATLPTVSLGCAFALPDSILQNRVFAAIEVRPGASFDEAAALEHMREHLPDYAVPERIFVHDEMPRTASGKVDRKALTTQHASSEAATVR
ncbi:class I adenylate-forming enzyme family protein [Leucobacter japonicus]|uniref:class I adenylate-forming enzyme family protein n=1 Tax=Leucobacter japonicus TaxID=1461259 RepID=UPI0009497F8D|nr:class I adenylate-forming enzyme family protein [Leucobacter japonicus]